MFVILNEIMTYNKSHPKWYNPIMNFDKKSSTGRTLIFVITLFAVVLIIFSLYITLLPRIRKTIDKTGIAALTSIDAESAIRPVWLFASPEDSAGAVFNISVRKSGASPLHDSMEALLSVHNTQGYVTYLPSHARLIGLTVVDGWCFISMSNEIEELNRHSYELATLQIRNTIMLADSTIKHIKLVCSSEHTIL